MGNVDAAAFDLARKIAGAYLMRLPPAERSRAHDDIYSDAMYGLAKADHDFDPARGVPFRAYAAMRIRNELVDGARHRLGRTGNQIRAGLVDPPRATDPDVYLDRLVGGEDDPAIVALESVMAAARTLQLAERIIRADSHRVIDLFVFRERLKGRTQADIGADIGVTYSRVSQIEKRIRRVLAAADLERP